MNKLKIAVFLLLLVGVTVIVFLPSLKNGFVTWDDSEYVTRNETIRSLSPDSVITIFNSTVSAVYHPLTVLSYAIEYRFFGLNPLCYHLTNLALHLLNCLLVFWLLYMLSKRLPVAIIGSILFALHPMHVESVAWVSERKDVLCAFFFLSSIISYVYYLRKDRRSDYYYAAIGLFIFSLLSKPMAVTLPLVLLLVDYFLRVRFSKNTLLEKAPFFFLSFIFGVIASMLQFKEKLPWQNGPHDILTSFQTANNGIIFYLYKLCAPLKLSCMYPFQANANGAITFQMIIAPAITAGIVIGMVILYKYSRKAFFGAAFFLITIAPVLQFMPCGVEIFAADRFVYIPSIGIFYLMGEAGLWLYERKTRYGAFLRIACVVMFVGVAIALASLTWERCKVWRDGVILWSDALSQYPDCVLAYNNRGIAYSAAGNFDKAIKDFNRAIEIDPANYRAYCNRGLLYDGKGDLKRAIEDYTRAIKVKPDFLDAYNNRGAAYYDSKDFDRAIADYNVIISIAPDYAKAYNDRAAAYFHKKEYDKSRADIARLRGLGYDADPELIDNLKKVSR